MPDTWATTTDVATYTRATVDTATLAVAQATIDIRAGRLPVDADRIGARDQYWLKLAVCYQAAWVNSQPDAFDRLDLTSSGGAQSTSYAPSAMTLAPFAKDALRRVSWLQSQSLHVRAPYEDSDPRRAVYGDDYQDPGVWRPI